MTNPILPPTALLRVQMPGVYNRFQIYDPGYNDPSYTAFTGQRIVPAVGSIVRDNDQTPLWVVSVDLVTFVPTYTTIPLSTENDNIVSILDYGNTVLRLFVDSRNTPYPVTPDTKCIFIGKSPRFYTLTRYSGTARESIISQNFDSTGKLTSQMVPLRPLDETQTSWYLPRCHVSTILDHNEEITVDIFSEDGIQVFSAVLFAKQSAVVNENVSYSPTIVDMTVRANQQLTNGTFYLYEKQDFSSLGFTAAILYDDGTSYDVPVDGEKCILYGADDFISSFAGLQQNVMIKYFRGADENITPGLADPTGAMITKVVPVTVIPNTVGVTCKIIPMPLYNISLARYIPRYWLFRADGSSHVDVTPYVTITKGTLVTDSSQYGVPQEFAIGVDMNKVDPVNYPTSSIYQQNLVMTFYPPNQLVRYTFRDGFLSQNIYGLDTPTSRRPSIKYDATLKQYFVPSSVFKNVQAFLFSFYTQATPPFDPNVSDLPKQPTHFILRDLLSGQMLTNAPITVANYAQAFNINGDTTGNYKEATVVVEFLYNSTGSDYDVLIGVPVQVSTGSYVTT